MATIRWFMVISERYKVMISRVLLILWLLCSPTFSFEATVNLPQVDEWANDIGKKIWSLAEDVSGSRDLRQAYQDSLKEVTTIDLTRLLNDSARKMEHYFSKKIASLQRIKERAEKAYGEQINETVQAEDVKYVDMINLKGSSINVSLTYDERFKKLVNTSYSGIQIPANVYNRGAKVLKTIKFSAELDEVFIDNLKNKDPSLKWQYFGSHDAVFRTYPAKIWTNQYYSARRRPWYTQGAASPKNVIILIDSSGSMVGKRSLIARVAVSNLIGTFSENDFFNVLYFNTDVKSLSCNRTLVQASKRSREWFKLMLSNKCINSANWELALTEAFKMLEESSGAKCQKMIMIFSDGTETKAENVFEKYNQDKKVRVFTYLVGTASHSSTDLIWMACSNKGYYYEISTVGTVRDLIEDYVSVLGRPMARAGPQYPPAVWTGVYRDASGLGMVVAGTLPVVYNGEFLGVCGMDVTVGELGNAVYQPYLGADGYSFLINNNGHIVKHPNLRSMLGYVKSAGDVDLINAEFVPSEAKDKLLNLRERMLLINDGEMDEQTLNAFLFTEYNHYLRAIPTQRHYIFTRIKRTPFSLALASSQFGYNVTQFQPFVIDSDQYNSNATVFLENWQHCTKNLPLITTIQELRRLLSDGECNGNLLLDLNITENMETVWKTKNLSQYNISLGFVKTNWGLQRLSEPLKENIITENLSQRIRNFKNDTVLVTAPYNSGGRTQDTDPNLLIYKGVEIDVSDMKIIPAVSGFLIKEENFVKEYLRNISSKDSYHVYLLDENAFIVSSSFNSSCSVTGQFFGSVDWELMAELEKGEEPLYRRFTFRNEQGECPVSSSKASSSSIRYPFYSSLTTFFSTWTKKVLACILQFNLYNWIFVDANTKTNQQAQSSTAKGNRTCVTNMTTYFGNITNWKSFSGDTSCLDCGSSEDFRRFFVAPVQHTNLVLVVVEHFAEKATFQYTKKKDGIPGRHVEISMEHDKCRSNSSLSRRLPMRCKLSEEQETNYSCGKAQVFGPNIILLVITNVLYFIVQLNRLHRK